MLRGMPRLTPYPGEIPDPDYDYDKEYDDWEESCIDRYETRRDYDD